MPMNISNTNNVDIRQVEFYLNISRNEYLKYYRGQVNNVLVTSLCGKKVKFPANLLISHVTHHGVDGRFVLQYLASGKVVKLLKIR